MTAIERLLVHLVGGGLLVALGFAIKLLSTACPMATCTGLQTRTLDLEKRGAESVQDRLDRLERIVDKEY